MHRNVFVPMIVAVVIMVVMAMIVAIFLPA